MNEDAIRQALMEMIVRAAGLRAEWDLLRTKVQSNERLPRPIRLAVGMIAARAIVRLDGIAGHVLRGFGHLEDGLPAASWRELGACESGMKQNHSADILVGLLVREAFQGGQHGQ